MIFAIRDTPSPNEIIVETSTPALFTLQTADQVLDVKKLTRNTYSVVFAGSKDMFKKYISSLLRSQD